MGVAAWSFMRDIDPNFMLPPTRLTVVLTQEFSQDIQRHIATYGFVDFDQLADFEWSHMLVVVPYSDPQQILEENGLRRQRMNSDITSSGGEGRNLLIFLNDDRVVAYIDVLGHYAGFDLVDLPKLPRNNTTFSALPLAVGRLSEDPGDLNFLYFKAKSFDGWGASGLTHWDMNTYGHFPPVSTALRWETPQKSRITYTNQTGLSLLYGRGHVLQKLDTEQQWFKQWLTIEPRPDMGMVTDDGFVVAPGESFYEIVDLYQIYGDLSDGEYRVLKHFDEDKTDKATGRISDDRLIFTAVTQFSIPQ